MKINKIQKVALATAISAGVAISASAPAHSVTPRALPKTVIAQTQTKVIQVAASKKGLPYRRGGTSPTSGFDCSGYTQWVFRNSGVNIPRTASQQQRFSTRVASNNLQKGDLIFFGSPAHHVGIVDNPAARTYWHSPHTGDRVKIAKWSKGVNFGRVIR